METLDKAWHTAADTLKSELSHLQSAERQWINQSGTEPMAGVQGKGTITDPYDGGNRDVQPGAPKGHQNTGRSVDLSSAGAGSTIYGKSTMEQSYTSYKTGGTGGGLSHRSGGIPEQRVSHITTASHTSGPRDAAQGPGMGTGSGYSMLSSMGDDSSTTHRSSMAQGLGGMSRSGISQGAGAAAGGSGMKSTLTYGSGSGAGSGSGMQAHQLSSDVNQGYNRSDMKDTTHGSRVTHAYERAGLGELGQKAGLGDYTIPGVRSGSSVIKSSGPDSSYQQGSGMTGSTRDTTLRDATHGSSTYSDLGEATSTSKPSGISKTYRGSDMTGNLRDSTTRDFGAQSHNKPHMGDATTTKTLDKDSENQGSGVTSTSRGLGLSQGYDRISTGQTATADKARSSGLKDTTAFTSRQPGYQSSGMTSGTNDSKYHGAGVAGATGLAQGYDRSGMTDMSKSGKMAQQSSMKDSTTPSGNITSGYNAPDMSGTTRDVKPTSGYNKSSSQMPETGDLSRKSGMRDIAPKSTGLTSGNQGLGMTNAARSAGTSGASESDSEYMAVSDIAKKAGLGAAATGLAAGVGSAMAGKSSSSEMKQGYQKPGAGQTSGAGDVDASRSGIVEPTPSHSSDLDPGYQRSRTQGSSMGGPAQDRSNLAQGYGGRDMGQKSTLDETSKTRAAGMDTGYQGAGMTGTSRDADIIQGSQGSHAGTMGQKSTTGGTTAAESGVAGSGYQNVGTTGTTGDSSLPHGHTRSGMGETDQKNLDDLDTSGLGEKSQDTDAKDTTSGSPSGRKPSLIQKAKKKIGLGSSDKKSPTMGDAAKSGIDEGYEKSGLKDQPGVDQAYQKAGIGDKAKSGIDGRYRGQGAGTQETTDISPSSRDMPQSDLGRSGHGTAEGAGIAGAGVAGAGATGAGLASTSKSTTGQEYQSSGMQDTSRHAGITDTSRSGMGQTYQPSGTGVTDSTTHTMPGSYDSYGTMDTPQGTGLTDKSRSGAGRGYEGSGMKDTTTSSIGQGHQATGSGLSQSTRSGEGHTYDTSGVKDSSEGVGLADRTKSGLSREHQSSGTMVPAIGDSMGSTIAEEEQPPQREIRVPSTITAPRTIAHTRHRRKSRVYSDTRAGPGRAPHAPDIESTTGSGSAVNQGYSKSGANQGQGYSSSGLNKTAGSGVQPGIDRGTLHSGVRTTTDRGLSERYQSSNLDWTSGSALDQGYERSGIKLGYSQPGAGTTAGTYLGQGYKSSELAQASGSTMNQPCPTCGMIRSPNQQGTGISSSTDKDSNYGQSYIGETARSAADARHESSDREGAIMSSMDQMHQRPDISQAAQPGTNKAYQVSGTSSGMGPSKGYQRSTGMGESTEPGMHQLNQDYQQSGIGETTRSGMGQDYQKSGSGPTPTAGTGISQNYPGSGSTGQGYQSTSQGGQPVSSMSEQRSQDYSAGNSSSRTKNTNTTTAGGSKVSQEALKGPQCPARDPYDFEKAIDNPQQKSHSAATPSGTTGGTTTKQAPTMSKAQKESLGPLDQMKVKFEKVIHPKK